MSEDPANLDNEKLLALGPQALSKAYLEILKKVQAGTILSPSEIKSLELLEKKLKGSEESASADNSAATVVDSMDRVAKHFGKSLRQVQRWAKKGMPTLSGGRYDLMQIEIWRRLQKGGRGPEAPDSRQQTLIGEGDKDFQDMRAKRAMANLRDLEYRVRLGEVVERKEVEQLFVARISAVKQGLLALARSLPPQLTHCQNEWDMEQCILRSVRELLEDFSRPLPEKIGRSFAHDGSSTSPAG